MGLDIWFNDQFVALLVKVEYQQEEDELDDVEEEQELDYVMEVEKKQSEGSSLSFLNYVISVQNCS